MKQTIYNAVLVLVATALLFSCKDNSNPSKHPKFDTKALLGEQLFSDTNLSLNRTQSCATCHNPERGFIDDRIDANGQISAVSLGDDGISRGDRNTPTAAYAQMSPEFHIGSKQRFNSAQPDYQGALGGQFLDGRASDLKSQAMGPPINPIEMGMPDKQSVVTRLQENSDYVESFHFLFGIQIFNDIDLAFAAMAESITAFEKTEIFAPFDSKYDRFLRGEYVYDPLSKSAAGKALFFSQQFTSCATCHQLLPNGSEQEMFTGYEYHNIGVPINSSARLLNGSPVNWVDNGLYELTLLEKDKGKFKTPTLRNIAITEPYMHNGVFRDLKTVVKFYDSFLAGSDNPINPETGEPWGAPEIAETVITHELADGRKLSNEDVESLVCFLRTLTDARYEHLIQEKGIDCGE